MGNRFVLVDIENLSMGTVSTIGEFNGLLKRKERNVAVNRASVIVFTSNMTSSLHREIAISVPVSGRVVGSLSTVAFRSASKDEVVVVYLLYLAEFLRLHISFSFIIL